MIKGFYENPQLTYSIAKDLKLSPKIRNKTRMLSFTTSLQYCTGSISQSNLEKKKERKKSHPNWKAESKMISIYRWHDCIYGKPKAYHTKIRDAKKNQHKNQLYFYTLAMNNLKMKKTIPFTIASKRTVNSGIKLSKEVLRTVPWKLEKKVERNERTPK